MLPIGNWKLGLATLATLATFVAALLIFTFAHLSSVALAKEDHGDAAQVAVDNRCTSLRVSAETKLTGAGGVILSSLSIPAEAKLVIDPIATPIKVSATPTFGAGAKIALSSDYAKMKLGRIVLMTYSGSATFDWMQRVQPAHWRFGNSEKTYDWNGVD